MAPGCSINLLHLPDEMLVKIATYLTNCGLYHLSLTCQKWKSIAGSILETLDTNVLWKEDLDLPIETLRSYWDHESRELHLRSMSVNEANWKKVMEMDFFSPPKVLGLTDCQITDNALPEALKPNTLKLIRCSPPQNLSNYLKKWVERFNFKSEDFDYYVDGGLTTDLMYPVFFFSRVVAMCSSSTSKRLSQPPLKLELKDEEAKGAAEEEVVVSGNIRPAGPFVNGATKDEILHFDNQVGDAVKKRRQGGAALGVTFSQGEQEDLFEVVVSSSTVGPKLMEQLEKYVKEKKAEQEKMKNNN